MAIFSRFRAAVRRASTEDVDVNVSASEKKEIELDALDAESITPTKGKEETPQLERPSEDVQRGVQEVEAVTLTWSRATLIAVFIKYGFGLSAHAVCRANIFFDSIWLLYFVNAMQSSILSNLLPYVTSDFSSHSLLNVIYIVSSAISAAVYIPLAKILDVWGRAEGFLIMTFFATLGLVLMAVCNNLPTFCAAYVSV
jgi:hypothetical protein